jgi:hypothetical protein
MPPPDGLDELLALFVSVALGEEAPAPARAGSGDRPRPDARLLERASAAHKIMRASDVDGPLLLSLVVWPPAELSAAAA